jgi:hypothetical protein
VLYARGGIYTDIKTVPLVPLTDLLPKAVGARPAWQAVVSMGDPAIAGVQRAYNGLLATPPCNPIFARLLAHMVELSAQWWPAYDQPNVFLGQELRRVLATEQLHAGVHSGALVGGGEFTVELLEEHVHRFRAGAAECAGQLRPDRYGYCATIWRRVTDGVDGVNDPDGHDGAGRAHAHWQLVARTRDPDYPTGWRRRCGLESSVWMRTAKATGFASLVVGSVGAAYAIAGRPWMGRVR